MNYRNTKFYKKLTSYEATGICEGFVEGDFTEDQVLTAWQYLVDTGLWLQLQGSFGRMAHDLIEQKLILPPISDQKDAYGNLVRGSGK